MSYLGEDEWWRGRLAFIAMSLPCLGELGTARQPQAGDVERGGVHANDEMAMDVAECL